MLEIEESLSAIASSDTIENLQALMSRTVAKLGYAAFSYIDVRRLPLSGEPVPFFVSTAGDEFNGTYISEGLASCDPVMLRAATTNAPFTWADCREYHAWKRVRRGARNRARYVWQVANDYGYTQGFALPTHAVDTAGRPISALVSLFWRDAPEALNTKAAMPAWLRLAASSMHERMLELRGLAGKGVAPPL